MTLPYLKYVLVLLHEDVVVSMQGMLPLVTQIPKLHVAKGLPSEQLGDNSSINQIKTLP
jgi:hypothetical protein